jgi:transcription elongation factor S-II
MDTQEEVLKIKKSLEKTMANHTTEAATSIDLLKRLKSLHMTLEILQKTRIGITVNNFRKAAPNDAEVNSLAKALIKSWKKFLHDDNESRVARISRSSSSTSSRRDSVGSTTSSGNEMDDSTNNDDKAAAAVSSTDANHGASGDASTTSPEVNGRSKEEEEPVLSSRRESVGPTGDVERSCCSIGPVVIPKASFTKDGVRLKCREMLAQALRTPPIVDGTADIDDVAAAVEDAIFDEFKNTEMKYKNRVRSRIANLKDTKNPRLREHALLCHIAPARLATMTPEEMASDEMKKIREKLSREAFNDHQMATNSGTMSDLFQCGRCKKRNTTYNQLQTRSSDEPMTTFVLCNECGNRWKFC